MTHRPEYDLCHTCMGTGIDGHPDSGYVCRYCNGCGGIEVAKEVLNSMVDGKIVRYVRTDLVDGLIQAGRAMADTAEFGNVSSDLVTNWDKAYQDYKELL